MELLSTELVLILINNQQDQYRAGASGCEAWWSDENGTSIWNEYYIELIHHIPVVPVLLLVVRTTNNSICT